MKITQITLFFYCVFFSVGIYLILCDLLHMPTLASIKTALKLTQGKKSRGYDAFCLWASTEISKHIHLDPYRKKTLTATLEYAEIGLTPETYLANNIVVTLIRLIIAVPFIIILPIVSPIVIFWAVSGFVDGTKKAEKIVSAKRLKIEGELPRFVSTVAQELSATRDVLSIFEGYRTSAGELFRGELEITIADMKSGSAEQALNRLAGRVGSSMLSQVVRGLLGVIRGGDGVIYFVLLAHDFQSLEVQRLEKEAQKRPGQLKKYSYILLGCLAASYIYVIIMQLSGSLGTLF